MNQLTRAVERKIEAKLPSRFAVGFDGWSANQTHFVATFATFPSSAQIGYDKTLLGFSPFEKEDSLSADAHLGFAEFVLGVYNRNLSNVVCFIGDNCTTNICLADKVPGNFIGCASHRFNMALKDIFRDSQAVVDKVHYIMKTLRRPVYAAKLINLTRLRA